MNLIRFDARREFWALINVYWWSDEKVSARLLLVAIVALTLGMVYMNIQIYLWRKQLFNSLQDKKLVVVRFCTGLSNHVVRKKR